MTAERCRLDVWLWRARFYKTRSQAAAAVEAGRVRIVRGESSAIAAKPAAPVRQGDGLAVMAGNGRLRSVEILGLGARRGPAAEARALYAETQAQLDGHDTPDHLDGAADSPEDLPS